MATVRFVTLSVIGSSDFFIIQWKSLYHNALAWRLGTLPVLGVAKSSFSYLSISEVKCYLKNNFLVSYYNHKIIEQIYGGFLKLE